MMALDTNVLARFFIDDVDDVQAARRAIDAFDKGRDLADALHLARSSRATGFATFDQRLAKRAKAVALTTPVKLLG